jgi:hypothetical protein
LVKLYVWEKAVIGIFSTASIAVMVRDSENGNFKCEFYTCI